MADEHGVVFCAIEPPVRLVGEGDRSQPFPALQLELVRGIGEGSIPYILSRVTIKIGAIETSIRVGWALIDEVPLILGRLDLFNQFSIEFREFEDKIILVHQSEFAAIS